MRTIEIGAPFSMPRIASTKAPSTVISSAPAASWSIMAALDGAKTRSMLVLSAEKPLFHPDVEWPRQRVWRTSDPNHDPLACFGDRPEQKRGGQNYSTSRPQ